MARARPGTARDAAFERDDGQALWVRTERMSLPRARPLSVVMVSDMTARISAERELQRVRERIAEQQRLRDLGELASGVAHDLNNALHALRLRLARLASNPDVLRTNEETLRTIDRIVDDAVERVTQLQDDAHNRCGERGSTVDLASVMEDAVELCRPGLEVGSDGSNVRIHVDVAPLPRVPGRPTELRHAFVNLILNSRDAMPAGGTIEITACTVSDQVVVTVSDDGTGIPPAVLPRMFDPFVTTKGRRGTGLGLAQVRRAMHALGGSISADNRPNGGAVFRLVFPVAVRPTARRACEPTAVPTPPSQRVLVIDDDPDNLDALRWVLETLGQEVEVAASGDDALARVAAGRDFALALCDVGMPGMSGWEIAGRIRERSPQTRVVLLTGWARDLAADPRRSRVDGILAKPLDLPVLRAVLSGQPPPDPIDASRTA